MAEQEAVPGSPAGTPAGSGTGLPADSSVGTRVARWVTGLFAPQALVIVLPPLIGLMTGGWPGAGWGLVASALCGGVPAGVIMAGVRAGRLDSHHLVRRESRTRPLLVAMVAVIAALVLLAVLDAPRLLVATVTAMLAALALTVPITLRWKISFHAAVSAGTVVLLAHVLPAVPTLAAGAPVVALICWARVRLGHHTRAQVAAGAVSGAGSAWATLAAFGI
ncbi:hypothetical protein [Planomonospora venezuelensis]|uniref:Uncharacterized membrane protein (DUF4010 family) n=1 Tax=Planomonospora venezuelensis TaxID=1999 RepID=A0A841DDQ1_PLAVE|nr:hypothetical protein [Planomonospora venezuelensis]MBB5966544.1 uncharacterized membrane protein (DUF4010 family) [Planomonospora venezuelensis]GIN02278.1 hypothetical protein Pve01_39360 [Planomonospora venezuelensis]